MTLTGLFSNPRGFVGCGLIFTYFHKFLIVLTYSSFIIKSPWVCILTKDLLVFNFKFYWKYNFIPFFELCNYCLMPEHTDITRETVSDLLGYRNKQEICRHRGLPLSPSYKAQRCACGNGIFQTLILFLLCCRLNLIFIHAREDL